MFYQEVSLSSTSNIIRLSFQLYFFLPFKIKSQLDESSWNDFSKRLQQFILFFLFLFWKKELVLRHPFKVDVAVLLLLLLLLLRPEFIVAFSERKWNSGKKPIKIGKEIRVDEMKKKKKAKGSQCVTIHSRSDRAAAISTDDLRPATESVALLSLTSSSGNVHSTWKTSFFGPCSILLLLFQSTRTGDFHACVCVLSTATRRLSGCSTNHASSLHTHT